MILSVCFVAGVLNLMAGNTNANTTPSRDSKIDVTVREETNFALAQSEGNDTNSDKILFRKGMFEQHIRSKRSVDSHHVTNELNITHIRDNEKNTVTETKFSPNHNNDNGNAKKQNNGTHDRNGRNNDTPLRRLAYHSVSPPQDNGYENRIIHTDNCPENHTRFGFRCVSDDFDYTD